MIETPAARLNLADVFELARTALLGSGAGDTAARSVARSIREAEAEGIRNVGLAFMPYYCEHLESGAIDGRVQPEVSDAAPAVVRVDAGNGFAHPAYDAAEALFLDKARTCGLAALGVGNAYYNGVEGYFARRIAEHGLVGFACSNAAAMVAPFGGRRPVFGTNPLAFGVPRGAAEPLVIDLSTSTTAFVNVADAAAAGRAIPDTWALDADGRPTTDPRRALDGALQPLGGAKGTGLALIVEVLAAGLTGGNWSHQAPKLELDCRERPRLGQFYLAIDPTRFGRGDLPARMSALLAEIASEEGVRLPGERRLAARRRAEAEGVEIDASLYRKLVEYSRRG